MSFCYIQYNLLMPDQRVTVLALLRLLPSVHTLSKKASPFAFSDLPLPLASSCAPRCYSEIEKELLARREAARFGATSGA